MPFGLLASGVRGEATNNMKSTGTVATSRSNRAALKRRVLTGCKSNSSNSNSSCSSESVQGLEEEEVVVAASGTITFEDLTNPSQVNIVSSDGNKYVLNGNTTYNENTRYHLYNATTYTLTNIPASHPMAIINNTGNITYTGNASNKSTKNVDGVSYDFYHGDITITVSGDFGKASLYCYYHGYMGGQNVLMYN